MTRGMSVPRTELGARIRADRLALGVTQAELAALVGGHTTQGKVSEWERGDYEPSIEQLAGLARALGYHL